MGSSGTWFSVCGGSTIFVCSHRPLICDPLPREMTMSYAVVDCLSLAGRAVLSMPVPLQLFLCAVFMSRDACAGLVPRHARIWRQRPAHTGIDIQGRVRGWCGTGRSVAERACNPEEVPRSREASRHALVRGYLVPKLVAIVPCGATVRITIWAGRAGE